MNRITRKTRICSLDTLDEELKTAMHAHALKHGLNDLESNVLICCETLSVRAKKGFWGGIQTTLSAAYVTPKWLVWADSTDRNDANVSASQLIHVEIWDDRATTDSSLTVNEGLNITGLYTVKKKTGMAFIALDSNADGRKFRQVLEEALSKSASQAHAIYQPQDPA
jgi:hypothetical protein